MLVSFVVCISNTTKKMVYSLNQELCIVNMLKDHGLEMGHSVRVPITQEWNKIDEAVNVL